MKRLIINLAVCGLMAGCMTANETPRLDVEKQLDYCAAQVGRALDSLRLSDGSFDYTMEPRNILEGETKWNCRKASAEEWCSGFWPGILWMDYGYLRGEGLEVRGERIDSLRKAAEGYTESLAFLAEQPVFDHDLGFLVINSFLKGYEATQSERYKQIALACADTLATLYNNKVGTILSWPRHVKDYGGHNTIMDNMINLELLFWAAKNKVSGSEVASLSGSEVKNVTSPQNLKTLNSQNLYDIAVRHAETTMKNHFREDGSCYHVAVYDTLTGEFLRGMTHQGYADSSMWSRGQSWAIYGYTMVYRYTKDNRFLDHAQKVTDIYLKRLHETSDDWVPIWDMDDPRGLMAPKDVSAACVVASALLELCKYVEEAKGKKYRDAAICMLADLSTDKYQSRDRNVAFLMHSTGHHPAGSEIDASIIYADYYYLEALIRLIFQTNQNFFL